MNIVIGTAGHIDHGKTSLIKMLTSIDTDRLKEEKTRGLSIDLGFAYLDLPSSNGSDEGLRVGIVDVPGHEKFVKNMLSGITGIDIVLFVVAADDSIMPQTREHLDIVNLLGVDKGIFVITKSDVVTSDRLEEVREDIVSALKGTTLSGSEILNVSSLTGDGFDELRNSIAELCIKCKQEENKKIFRLPVDRSFTVKGFGTVVTGTVCSGSVKVGSEVSIFPISSKPYRVRGLQSHGVEVKDLSKGTRGAVNLSSINVTDIKRGDVLLEKDYYDLCSKVYRVDCKLTMLDTAKDLKDGAELKLYHYSKEVVTKIRTISKVIKKGSTSYGRLYLREPLAMLRGDRFILRDTSENRTVGGGVVVLPHLKKQIIWNGYL